MIAVIDTETTGLLKDGVTDWLMQPGIVQLGVVMLDPETLEERSSFETAINPELPVQRWEEGAIKTHGISPDDVKNAPTLMGAFGAFAQSIVGATHWAGYNIRFDKGVIWHQLFRYGFERHFPWPPRDLEVMDLVSKHLGTVPGKRHNRWKLGDAYAKIVGTTFEEAHDALADVRATAQLLKKLRHGAA